LNLEGNAIELVPTLTGLVSLGELNVRKNKIKRFMENSHLKKLFRLMINDNKITEMEDLEDLFGVINLAELSIEQNRVCEHPHFKTYLVSKLTNLKLLEGRRILDETKRTALKLAQREQNRKRDLEKKAGYIIERYYSSD
jgi:Leucine-rich repeat (LRR) protein